MLKVAWEGDDESLHEADALELWDGDGAVRLLRRSDAPCAARAARGTGRRSLGASRGARRSRSPSTSLAAVATGGGAVPAGSATEVPGWLDEATQGAEGSELVPLARELFASSIRERLALCTATSITTTSFATATRFVAIDPKPYLADREYDVALVPLEPADNLIDDRGRDRAAHRRVCRRRALTTSGSARGP